MSSFFIYPSLVYVARDYHWLAEESTGFIQVGGIGTPGLLGSVMHGLFMRQVNDPLLKSPIASLSSNGYRIYRFCSLQGIYREHLRSNYAWCIPNHSEKKLTGVAVERGINPLRLLFNPGNPGL